MEVHPPVSQSCSLPLTGSWYLQCGVNRICSCRRAKHSRNQLSFLTEQLVRSSIRWRAGSRRTVYLLDRCGDDTQCGSAEKLPFICEATNSFK